MFALPLAIASLCGWAPKSVRRRTTLWGIRVRGVALLVVWVGGLMGGSQLGKWFYRRAVQPHALDEKPSTGGRPRVSPEWVRHRTTHIAQVVGRITDQMEKQ